MPRPLRAPQLSAWGQLVAICGAIVVVVGALAISWSAASSHERQVQYAVRGTLNGIELDLGDASVVVARAPGAAASVEHVDRYGFGHAAVASRTVADGMFKVRSRCPHTVLHGCSVRYRLRVPDNVPLTITTTSGSVALRGYRGSVRITTRGGDVDVRDYCGFFLAARSDGGDVSVSTSCQPQQLVLRTTTGRVDAAVPPGRYRIDASTSGGAPVVRGLESVADAPFMIQALSSSGHVLVERQP